MSIDPKNKWQATQMWVVNAMLDLVDLNGKRFVDLGAGDGRVVKEAVARGAIISDGVEYDTQMKSLADINVASVHPTATILQGDAYTHDLTLYDVVSWGLTADQQAADSLKGRLTSQHRVITFGAPIPGLTVVQDVMIPMEVRDNGLDVHFQLRGYADTSLFDDMPMRDVLSLLGISPRSMVFISGGVRVLEMTV